MPASNCAAPRSILVVEDHDLSASLILELLRSAFPVAALHRAASAGTGLVEFARLRPALLVVDIGLPDRCGLDMTRCIAALDPAAPVVIYSAQDSAVIREGAAAAGARAFVSKNNPGELLEVVTRLLAAVGGVENSPQDLPDRPTDAERRGS